MLGSIVGGLAGGIGSWFGGQAQADAAKKAMQHQTRQFDYRKGITEPWMERGNQSNELLNSLYGIGGADGGQFNNAFYNSPYYNVMFKGAQDSAEQEVNRNASASGQLNSGRRLMALSDRNRQLVSENALNPFVSGLTGVSNQGFKALNSMNTSSQNYGNAAAKLAQDRGAAKASQYMGVGNSINNTLADITQQGAQAFGAGGQQRAQSTSGYGPQNIMPNSYYNYPN